MADAIRVLYVDDETGLLEIGKLYLEESGDFSVTTITSAPVALDLLNNEKFDAIVSDYQMPGMDGIEFLIEVRARFGNIPFILFTGRGREEVVIQAINSGADFYLQKGGDPGSQFAELSHKIKSAALRKRAEEALRESESTFRVHIENSFDVIFTLNEEGNFVFLSPAWERHFGYPVSDVIGKSFVPFVHPDDIAPLVEYLKRVLTTGQSETSPVYRVRHANGRWIWFVANGTPYNSNKGERQFIGVGRDITERKVAEEELRISEEKFRKAFFTSPNSICITRLSDGMFVSINKGFTEITGYTEEDVMDKTSLEINIWKDPMDRWKIVEGLQANGEVRNYEAWFLTKTGEIYGSMSTSIIELNGVPHILNITHDITNRKQAEEALQKNEERYKYISEMTTDFVFSCIKPNGGIYSIDWMAGAVERITGYTIDEMLAMGCWRCLVHSNDTLVFDENITNLSEGESGVCKLRILTKSGTTRWIEVHTIHVPNKDSSLLNHVFGGCRDITDLKLDEWALRESEERFRLITETIDEAFWMADVEIGKIFYVSPSFERIWGRSRKSLYENPRSFLDAVHLEDRERVLAELEIEKTGQPFDHEYRIITPDGNIKYIWDRGFPIIRENGQISTYAGVAMDITQRKRAEEERLINGKRLQMTQEIGHIGCWEYDIKTNQMWGSEEGCYLFGYPRVAGSFPIENFVSCITEPELILKAFNDLIMEGKEYDLDFVINPKDGSAQKTLHSIGKLEKDEQGNPVKVKGINQDITKRKQAEVSLKISQLQLFEAMNLAQMANWQFDVASGIFTFDDSFYSLYGTSVEIEGSYEMPADVYANKFVHPEDLHMVADEVNKAIEATDPAYESKVEHRIIRRDGEIRHIIVRIRITKDENGKTIRAHGVNQDISGRKRAEDALRESEEKYRLLTEKVHDGIYIYRGNHFLYTNSHVSEMTGYSSEELLAMPFIELVHPDDRASIEDMAERRSRGEPVPDWYECRIIKKNGDVRNLELTVASIQYRGGVASLGAARDITERKRAHENLISTLKRTQDQQAELAMISLSPHLFSGDVNALSVILTQVSSGVLGVERVSVWLFNNKGDELRCIDLFEKSQDRHSRDLVLKRHEYVNEFQALSTANFIDAHDPLTDPRTAGYVQGYLKPNRITSMLDAVIRVSGQNLGLICFEHVDRPHHWESDEIAFACQLADQIAITILNRDRKLAEDALFQTNKKLNLLSGVTRHDITNKVLTIQGFLELARKSKNIDETLPFLDKIQDSATAIEHQIDFSKDYQNLGVNLPKWLNLSDMIISASNPAIQFFDETGTLQIFADPLFEKVMYNLVDNTIRHGETATEVHISVISESESILIIWADNGVGIPVDKKEKIFHRGYGKNTGFGLFLIREILTITGMTIQENGEPGKGARFEIKVPNGKWRYGSEAG